jgi:hypothetical protein
MSWDNLCVDEDLKLFIRETLLRFDRLVNELSRGFNEMHEQHLEHSRRLDDVIEENRAQRTALFRILDRLDGGGAAA